MLTFEFSDNDKLELHGDREGLLELASILTELAGNEEFDHAHLMVPEWGGTTLSAVPMADDSTLFKHVKIFIWPTKDK